MKWGILKFFSFLVSLLTLLALIMPTAQVQAATTNVNLVLSPATQTVNALDTITVTVQAQAATQNVDGIDVYIDFDPNYLSVTSMTAGTALGAVMQSPTWDNTAGTTSFSAGQLTTPYPTGTFTVETIIFQAKSIAASRNTTVSFHTATPRNTIVDYLGANITGSLTGATYAINVPDTTRPTVQSTTPANGATNIPLNSTVAITFSKPMNATSVQAAFSIDQPTLRNFSWNPAGTVMTFTPGSSLSNTTTYSVGISTAATDTASTPNHLAAAYAFSFTTLPATQYTVTAPISPSAAQTAGCSVSGKGNFNANDPVSLQATATSGWTFGGWSSSDITIANPAVNPLAINMPAKNVAVTATFTMIPPALSITTTSPLPGGTVGTVYNQTLAAAGGTTPYTWALNAGSTLPAGLTLSSGGLISGAPTAAGGPTGITFKVTDSSSPPQTAIKPLSITINKAVQAFSGLSCPTIIAGDTPTVLGGKIASGSQFPTGNVSITLNAVTQVAAIQSDGTFSSSFVTSGLTTAGSPYAITYSYSGDLNFNAVSDNTNTLTVTVQNTYKITASVNGGNGTVSVNPVNVAPGGTATVTITPNSGYDIGSITDNGQTVPINKPYSISNVTAKHDVVVTFIRMYTVTTNVNTGGTISPFGPAVGVLSGINQPFAIIPFQGYSISDVTVDGSSVKSQLVNNTYTFSNISADHTLDASFTSSGGSSSFTLYEKNNKPMTDNTGIGTYAAQTFTPKNTHIVTLIKLQMDNDRASSGNLTVSIRTTNADGTPTASVLVSKTIGEASLARLYNTYSFDLGSGWVLQAGTQYAICMFATVESPSNKADVNNPYAGGTYFTGSSDGTIWTSHPNNDIWFEEWGTAAAPTQYAVTASVNGGNGTANADPSSVNPGGSSTVTITPNTGYHLSALTDNGTDVLSQVINNIYTISNINATQTVLVAFAQNPTNQYTLTVTPGNGGSVAIAPIKTAYNPNDSITLTATPLTGYTFSGWNSSDITISNPADNPLNFNMPAKNVAVTATFTQNATFTITAGAGPGGTISPSGDVQVQAGASQTFIISANEGHQMASLMVDGVAYNLTPSITLDDVSANHTISATFTQTSGGGDVGGGGGGWGPPANNTITTPGLICDNSLTVDASGLAQSFAELKSADGNLILDITNSTKLLDSSNSPLKTLSAGQITTLPDPYPNILILAYVFGPDGAKFAPALTLTLKYDSQKLPANSNENELYLANWDGSSWVKLDSNIDTQAKTVSAGILHFSTYALIAKVTPPPPPASFILSNVIVSPAQVNPTDTVTIQTAVSNNGGSSGIYTAVLKVNGTIVDSRDVTLDAGNTQTVTFKIVQSEPGNYVIDINGNNGQFTVAAPPLPTPTITKQAIPEPVTPTLEAVKIPASTAPSPTSSPEPHSTYPAVWIILGIAAIAVIAIILIFSQRTTK